MCSLPPACRRWFPPAADACTEHFVYQVSWNGTELCALSPVNRNRDRRYVLTFDLSGARVQVMNTLTQVEETGTHTRWTCIHTYSV